MEIVVQQLMGPLCGTLLGFLSGRVGSLHYLKKCKLQNHVFFTEMRFLTKRQIAQTHFSDDPTTDRMVKEIMSVKFKRFHDACKDLFLGPTQSQLIASDKEALQQKLMDTLDSWETSTRSQYSKSGLPEPFAAEFERVFSEFGVNTMKAQTDLIFRSDYYADNVYRCNAVLNSLLATFETLLMHCEHRCGFSQHGAMQPDMV
jgi:hypothetical protein